jgi:hypothetical protein
MDVIYFNLFDRFLGFHCALPLPPSRNTSIYELRVSINKYFKLFSSEKIIQIVSDHKCNFKAFPS